MKILLTAEPRTGKSTAIKKITSEIGVDNFVGFYTEEVRKSGDRVGFQIVNLDSEKGYLAHVDFDSKIKVGRYGVDLSFFEENTIPKVYRALEKNKIIIIDEIGPMQAYSNDFKKLIEFLLRKECNLIGTILLRSHAWIDTLKTIPNVEIIRMTLKNRDEVATGIVERLKESTH